MSAGIVVVGAGLGGVQAAEQLRAGGYAGPLTLLGDEPGAPYHRPPLSKGWLSGETSAEQLVLRAPEALARRNIDFHPGVRVLAIDRAARRVHVADGTPLPYCGLVLATGARARALTIAGADTAGIHALRSRADAERIAARLAQCARLSLPVVVIGGGFIGLEVAATARKKGLAVTVLEAAPRLLGRVAAPALSTWYAALHRRHGVELLLDAGVAAIEPEGETRLAVHCASGARFPAGLVVAGVGAEPDDRLARDAGLACERGIVVDACSRSSDPAIVAVGDCTARRQPDGSLLRLESVQNATEQAKSAAAALLGQERPFSGTPWFWSDQFGTKLQMAGLGARAEHSVTRTGASEGSFSLFHFCGARLVAVDSVNSPRDHLLARKLLDAACTPTPDQAADPGFELATLLTA